MRLGRIATVVVVVAAMLSVVVVADPDAALAAATPTDPEEESPTTGDVGTGGPDATTAEPSQPTGVEQPSEPSVDAAETEGSTDSPEPAAPEDPVPSPERVPAPPAPPARMVAEPAEGAPAGAVTEIVSARRENVKMFESDAGEVVAQVFAAPVHVADEQGRLVDIDLSPVQRDGRVEPARPLVGVSMARGLGAGVPLVSVETDRGLLGWSLAGAADVAPTQLEREDGTVSTVYDSVFPGVQLRLTPLVHGVKDELVLAGPDTPRRFTFALTLPVGTVASIGELGDVEIRTGGRDGELVAVLSRGFMEDSSAHPESGAPASSDGVTYQLSGVPTAPTLTMTLDEVWLADDARVWPVTIDPETITAPGLSDDTWIRSGATTNWSSSSRLEVGDSGYGKQRALLHFNMTTFLTEAIKSATMQVRIYHAGTCGSTRRVDAYRINESWSGSSVTWSNRPATGNYMGAKSFSCPYGYYGIPLQASYVQQWANSSWDNHGMMLIAHNESSSLYWKKLFSVNAAAGKRPYMNVVIYMPKVPINRDSTVNESDGNVTFEAEYDDEIPGNNTNGGLEIKIYDSSNTQVHRELLAGSEGTITSWTKTGLPAGDYTWRVKSYREYVSSDWSPAMPFTVDRTPQVPTLQSPPADDATIDTFPDSLQATYRHPLDQSGEVVFQLDRQASPGSWTRVGTYWSESKNDGQTATWNDPPLAQPGVYRWRARGEEVTGSDVSGWSTWWTFTVDGPADGIGQRKAYTFEEFGLNDRMSAQVNVSNGNLLLSATDLTLAGTGIDLSISRFYNSLSQADSTLGRGWVLSVGNDVRLDIGTDTVTFHAPTGYATDFDFDSVLDEWVADDTPGIDAELTEDGTGWELEWRDGQVYRFDATGRWIEHRDANGNDIDLVYDDPPGARDRLTEVIDTRGRTVEFGYAGGQLDTVTEKDAAGTTQRVFSYGYSNGRLAWSEITSYAADPSDPNLGQRTLYRYDSDGRLDEVEDPRGAITNFGYDGTSRTVATVTRSATTNTSGVGGGTGAAPTRFFYDASLGTNCANESPAPDHQVRVEGPRVNDTAGAQPEDVFDVTTYCFDEHDRQQVTFDARNHRRSQDYTSKSNVTTYNESGIAASGTQGFAQTTFDWQNDQMRGVELPTGGTSTLDYAGSPRDDLPTSVTNYGQTNANDANSTSASTWDLDYDEDGNLIEVSGYGDNTLSVDEVTYAYCYNTNGTVDRWTYQGDDLTVDPQTGACSGTTPATATVYSYTGVGELGTVDPPGPRGTVAFTYDHASRIRTRTDGRGVVATYSYDAMDRTTGISFDDGSSTKTVTYGYDPNGNMTSRTNSDGSTDSYVFDELNRMTAESSTRAGSRDTRYGYNRAGLVTETAIDDLAGGTLTTSSSYDDLNRLQTLQDPDGRQIDVDYDDRGNRAIREVRTSPSGPVVFTQQWHHDHSSRITCTWAHTGDRTASPLPVGNEPYDPPCDHTASGLLVYQGYTYGSDDDNRLVERTDIDGTVTAYSYDDLSRLSSAVTGDPATPSREHIYTYDERANLTSEQLGGTAVVDQDRTQRYDLDGALCWVVDQLIDPLPGCGAAPTGAETFAYDPAGNMTDRDGLDLAYNPLGQTSSFDTGGGQVDLGYADVTSDRRTSKGDLVYDHTQAGLQVQTDTTGGTALFVREPSGQLLGMIDPDSGDDLYYLLDRLGSVIATIDPTGTIDTVYDYQPYGQQINPTAGDTNPYRYVSGYHDTDTGLIKFGTRYYMPDLARWTQPDPQLGNFTEPFSLDPYQYVQANPTNGVDPNGRHAVDWATALDIAAIGFGIGAAAATGGASLALTAGAVAASAGSGYVEGGADCAVASGGFSALSAGTAGAAGQASARAGAALDVAAEFGGNIFTNSIDACRN